MALEECVGVRKIYDTWSFQPEELVVSQQREKSVSSKLSESVMGATPGIGWWATRGLWDSQEIYLNLKVCCKPLQPDFLSLSLSLSLSLTLSLTHTHVHTHIQPISTVHKYKEKGGARGVMVIVIGVGHDDTSSNPGRDWLHFT